MNKGYLLLLLIVISCQTKKEESKGAYKATATTIVTPSVIKDSVTSGTSLKVDYMTHKDLLTILPLLPDQAMDSWEWTVKDRKAFEASIAKNNSFTDTTPDYNNIQYIKPNTLGTQVVDGFWSISIYKTAENSFIVITDDKVGDGNTFMCFEYKKGHLTEIPFDQLFAVGIQSLLKEEVSNSDCSMMLEDSLLTFDYLLTDPQTVTISSWSITKEEAEQCFTGNTLNYKFNPKKKVFDLISTTWVAKGK